MSTYTRYMLMLIRPQHALQPLEGLSSAKIAAYSDVASHALELDELNRLHDGWANAKLEAQFKLLAAMEVAGL
jgi:hypothetical protein